MSNLGIVSLTMTLAGRLNPANASKEMASLPLGLRLRYRRPFFTGFLQNIQEVMMFRFDSWLLNVTWRILIVIREFFLKKDRYERFFSNNYHRNCYNFRGVLFLYWWSMRDIKLWREKNGNSKNKRKGRKKSIGFNF